MGTTTTHRLHKQDVGEDEGGGGAVDYQHADRQLKSPGSEIGAEKRVNEKRKGRWEVERNLLRS
jgi:hypothetical protein